jgi:hypothetical protein
MPRILTGAMLALALLGCTRAPKLASPSGTVRFQGKPLPGGYITFAAPSGQTMRGMIQPDGTYTLNDVPTGELAVAIETESIQALEKTVGKTEGFRYVKIPKSYADIKTSELTARLEPGVREDLDFDLK